MYLFLIDHVFTVQDFCKNLVNKNLICGGKEFSNDEWQNISDQKLSANNTYIMHCDDDYDDDN